MKILFMGTPDFAVFTLRALIGAGHEICAVVTQPDKPRGRGYAMTPPPVKVCAAEAGIPVLQPATLRDESVAAELAGYAPQVIVVVAYGKILPKNILDLPPYGCINLHGSLLPEYRGAAPMQRAILDGKPVTGVTTMYMAEGMDTGDMLLRREISIEESDNFEDIHDKLGKIGAVLMLETLEKLEAGTLTPVPQDDSLATYAAKITKDDCLVCFDTDARTVHNRIRGLSPIPLAFTHTPDGRLLKLVSARIAEEDQAHDTPGEILSLEDGITVACRTGSLTVTGVLPEGKGRMSACDYVRGRRLSVHDVLR